MTQPTKREQLAAMRLEDFKAHLRTIAGEDPKAEIIGAARANPMLVRDRKKGKAFFDLGHALADQSKRRTGLVGYAAFEIHPVMALRVVQ